MSELARLDTHRVGGIVCASIEGELDMSSAPRIESKISNAAPGDEPLVVDLTAVTFMDSAGVRFLDHLVAAREPTASIRVVPGSSGRVPFILRLCGFRDELLTESVESALAALAVRDVPDS